MAIDGYRPRNPETTLLYQVVADQLETFLARQQERGRRRAPPYSPLRAYTAYPRHRHGLPEELAEFFGV